MSKVYFFGDIHFSSMHPWLVEAGNNFISFFKKNFSSQINQNDYVVFLGDITDKDVNPGLVIKQAYQLFDYCNKTFKKTYVLTGNHDKKLYRDIVQSSLQFLDCFDNIHVIEDIEKIKIENKTILALPHKRLETYNLNEYYSNYDWQEWSKENGICDVGIGHWAIKDDRFMFSKSGVDISKIPANKWVVGHIHTRPTPVYSGSIWPCNHTEQICNYPRCIKEWDLDNDTWNEINLPQFISYEEVNYPEAITEAQDNIVHVYLVNGIKNISEAKSFYKDKYIRDICRNKINKELESVSSSKEIFLYKNNKDALDAMIKETKMTISRPVFSILNNIL